MARILITGGAGYIGSHTVKRLAGAGEETVVLDNLTTGHRDLARWGEFVRGDVRDPSLLDRIFGERPIDAVIHFAAMSQVGESVREPLAYYDNNVAGAIALLSAMRRHDVHALVFSSTCAVYGPPFDMLLTEEHPLLPISPYARSKRMIETMLEDCERAFGLKSVRLRYFNAAGADPEAEIGERHIPETHLIPLVLQVAQGLRAGLRVFGDDYDTPDGTAIRDYVHVQDLADAHLSAVNRLLAGGGSGTFNLGGGKGCSVREIIAAAREVTGRPISTTIAPRRPGDSPRLVGSGARARAELGWAPRFTDIREIIATAWEWQKRDIASR